MKNYVAVFAVALVSLFVFAQCKKELNDNEVYNAGFYSSRQNGKLFLYIDGAYKGELPYFAAPPTCEQNFSETQSPFYYTLKSGEYKIEGKDERGNLISSGTLRMNKSEFGGTGYIGGQDARRNGDCVMVGLYE